MVPLPTEVTGQEEEEEEAEVVVEKEEDYDDLSSVELLFLFPVQRFVVPVQHEKKMSFKQSEMAVRTHFY